MWKLFLGWLALMFIGAAINYALHHFDGDEDE